MERRPYLHIYAHSNELEETGIVSLTGVNVESDPHKESLLGVRSFVVHTIKLNNSVLRNHSRSLFSLHPIRMHWQPQV